MNPILKPHEPPIRPRANALAASWGTTDQLAPGVWGTAYEEYGLIYIPLIIADKEGAGDVGRFLDRLSTRCRIVSVTSSRLRGMLLRRGWICEDDSQFDDVWMRK